MWSSRLFWKFFAVAAALALLVCSLTAWAAGAAVSWWLPPLVFLFALLAALWLYWQVAAPLGNLATAVRRATDNGRIDPRIGKRWDELGRLADALRRLERAVDRRLDVARQSNRQLSTVLDSMVEGVLAVAPDQSILLANNSSRRLLDFPVEQPVGRPLLEVTRCRPVCEALLETLRTRNPQSGEFESPGKERRVLALRTTRLPGDPCPGAMVVLHDITDLRRLENLRREFVANVSHELKTPLAAVKAYAETLRMGAVNDRENNLVFVQRIEEQADRLHQLIIDLLQIARVESGQQAFDMRDIELGAIIRDCVAEFDEAANGRGLELRIEPAAEPVYVHADEEGVRQIIGNLVDNAVKYTPVDGRVTVSWKATDGTARIEVRDTGIGIADEDQARIFERFYRVDKARSRELGGTGLGLSIVKHLTQAFGGRVDVLSQLGAGSTFGVELPLR